MANNEESQTSKNKSKIWVLLAFIAVATTAISYLILDKKIVTSPKNNNSIRINNNKALSRRLVKTTIEDKDFTQNLQIEELQEKIKNIEVELDSIKLKNNDLLLKIIISFTELRSVIELEENYTIKLQEFSTLVIKDQNLNLKSEILTKILNKKNYKTSNISTEFQNSISTIINLKATNNSDGIGDKIKNSLLQLIRIRKIDGSITNEGDEIDLAIIEIERAIKEKSYKIALDKIDEMEDKYQKTLSKLVRILKTQIELEEVSNEIFLYLKKIVNNV